MGERRSVKLDVEKTWPRKVRSLYGRLRTEHAMELGYYQYKMEKVTEKEAYCKDCGEDFETTKHLLCSCPALAVERQRQFEGGSPRYSDLVLKPEQCRKLLSKRFPDLVIKNTVQSPMDNNETLQITAEMGGSYTYSCDSDCMQ